MISGPHAIDEPYTPHLDAAVAAPVTNASERLQLPAVSEVFWIAVTQPTWIRFGNASVVADVGNMSMLLPIGGMYLRWPPYDPNNYIAFIRDTAPNGMINVMPMAA